MKELVEQKLTKKIRQVFDQFEDDSAELGWQELLKKYPEKKNKKPLFIWFSSAAAILLVFSGLWFFTPEKYEQQISFRLKSATEKLKDHTLNEKEKRGTKPTLSNTDPTNAYSSKKTNQILSLPYFPQEKDAKKLKGKKERLLAIQSQNQQFKHVQLIKEELLSKNTNTEETIKGQLTVTEIPSLEQKSIGISGRTTLLTGVEPKNTQTEKIYEMLKENKDETKLKQDKKINFAVYAGSYLNYAKGSENNINLGAGFLSDIPLNKRLKFSTGIAIGKNTLSYAKQAPASILVSASNFILSKLPTVAQPPDLSLPAPFSNDDIKVTEFNASFLNLDIPINLKYQLSAKPDKLYLVAGLSSGTFIQENYTYKYKTTTNKEQSEVENKSFNDFDFASTFNISFGLSSSLNKTQNLTFEPFLKYPLGGSGSQNIRFGAAGINVKLNFKSK
ncbi:MAG: hypothetical protein WBP45_08485 [Daejeonella sp.]